MRAAATLNNNMPPHFPPARKAHAVRQSHSEPDLNSAVEFIKDRLYYICAANPPKSTSFIYSFNIDNELLYHGFFADFGPLNLSCVYRFVKIVDEVLAQPDKAKKKIYLQCGTSGHHRANAAFLICAYCIISLGRTADEAYRPFLGIYPPFIPFRDAAYGLCTFNLTILDCLKGLQKAMSMGWFSMGKFNAAEYDHWERVENGDLNWIVPGLFLAFCGPHNTNVNPTNGYPTCTPENYTDYFRKTNVTAVIRLNKKMYDKKKFTDAGIRHYDMYFPDGGCPSEAIMRKFIEVCENEPGALAVHCKAGLGRTGTLISCYMMKHFKFTAAECIGWLRICRPGSVIGPQQHFLKEMQPRMWKAGDAQRKKNGEEPIARSEGSSVTAGLKGLSVERSSNHGAETFERSGRSSAMDSPTRLPSGGMSRRGNRPMTTTAAARSLTSLRGTLTSSGGYGSPSGSRMHGSPGNKVVGAGATSLSGSNPYRSSPPALRASTPGSIWSSSRMDGASPVGSPGSFSRTTVSPPKASSRLGHNKPVSPYAFPPAASRDTHHRSPQ